MFWVPVRENLKHRPTRTILTILLIAAPVTLMLLLGGVNQVTASTSISVRRTPPGMWMAVSAAHCFGVVLLSLHAAVMQRTRELGILGALGASSLFLLNLILADALKLSLGGVAAGVAFSSGAGMLLNAILPPRLQWAVAVESWLLVAAVAIGTATLGCIVPAIAAIRLDVVDALERE